MNWLFRCCFAILAATFALWAPAFAEDAAPPPDPARVAAARDLMEVTGVTQQIDGIVDAMKRSFAQAAQSSGETKDKHMTTIFDAALSKLATYREEMLGDFAKLYAATFTADEMKAVADFYRSGTGAKFITMMPKLIEQGSQIGMKYSQKIMEDAKAAAAAASAPTAKPNESTAPAPAAKPSEDAAPAPAAKPGEPEKK